MMRLVRGVGDRGGLPSSKNNKAIKSYRVWVSMIERCYAKPSLKNYPSYIGCTVCDEWLYYPEFLTWFKENYKNGFHLDKDLKNLGSKVYSPANCSFVPSEINSLTISCKSSRGKLPQGVVKYKAQGLYMAKFRENGKINYIGYFKSKRKAFNAYREKKLMHIIKTANAYFASGDICYEVFSTLLNWEINYND